MDHEEECQELQKLKDWREYYLKRLVYSKRSIYATKRIECEKEIKRLELKLGLRKPKSFLKPIIDEATLHVSLAVKDSFKKSKPTDTGQLKRSITGKKDQIDESLKEVAKIAGVDFEPKHLRRQMRDYYNKLTPEQKKSLEVMYESLRPADGGEKDGS